MPRSPQWMDLYQIWFRVSSRGRNQLCGILLQSAHGFRFWEGSKFAISHWLGRSPLTQCWRYRTACDSHNPVTRIPVSDSHNSHSYLKFTQPHDSHSCLKSNNATVHSNSHSCPEFTQSYDFDSELQTHISAVLESNLPTQALHSQPQLYKPLHLYTSCAK